MLRIPCHPGSDIGHNGDMSIDTADLPEPEEHERHPFDRRTNTGWLNEVELLEARSRLPMVYVEAIPVRLDALGRIEQVGLLMRSTPEGVMTRAFVSGRVRYGESLREALFRHLENDLGPMAFPQLPLTQAPAQVAEYFPIPGISHYVDERQHAVSLVYVVPVTGTCDPRQDALEVTWLDPDVALSEPVLAEFAGGRGRLLRLALASAG